MIFSYKDKKIYINVDIFNNKMSLTEWPNLLAVASHVTEVYERHINKFSSFHHRHVIYKSKIYTS